MFGEGSRIIKRILVVFVWMSNNGSPGGPWSDVHHASGDRRCAHVLAEFFRKSWTTIGTLVIRVERGTGQSLPTRNLLRSHALAECGRQFASRNSLEATLPNTAAGVDCRSRHAREAIQESGRYPGTLRCILSHGRRALCRFVVGQLKRTPPLTLVALKKEQYDG
jgi:hypothetical protein